MSTRRSAAGTFDHGAQFFTAHDPDFRAEVRRWQFTGLVEEWTGRFVEWPSMEPSPERQRYVGTPRMSSLTRYLSAGLANLRSEARVTRLDRNGHHWLVFDSSGELLARAPRLVLALPAPQAVSLLSALAPAMAAELESVAFDPCLAAMVTTGEGHALPFDAATVSNSPIAWVACQNSKPRRVGPPRYVLHATADWSRTHLEHDTSVVAGLLYAAFVEAFDIPGDLEAITVAHRWRFARVSRPLARSHVFDAELSLGACGDWCIGPRVEAAWLSGRALARSIVDAEVS